MAMKSRDTACMTTSIDIELQLHEDNEGQEEQMRQERERHFPDRNGEWVYNTQDEDPYIYYIDIILYYIYKMQMVT